jgi:hypothetical protein
LTLFSSVGVGLGLRGSSTGHCHPHVVADHSRVHVVVGVEEHTDYRDVDLRAVG